MRQRPPRQTAERSTIDELAAEYLEELASSSAPSIRQYLERLGTLDERRELLDLLRFAVAVEDCLPARVDVGQCIDQYLLRKELGRGGMGRVFLADDLLLERPVAVKVLRPSVTGPEFLGRFREECRFLARLHHPNIVAIHNAGFHGQLSYLVMDLVDGRSLRSVVDKVASRAMAPRSGQALAEAIGRPEETGNGSLLEPDWFRSVARIVRRAVSAIEAAHAQGILHRDINPRNIMLTGGGHPVLLDFGLAGAVDASDTFNERLVGTVSYLAPEQIECGCMGADKSTDVYQLGLILYELLTLRAAYQGDSLPDITARIQQERFPWPCEVQPNVPRDLEAICLRAMQHQPERRYASAALLGADLDRFLEGKLPRARPPGALQRIQLRVSRQRWVLALRTALAPRRRRGA